jgi:hypothetical protein
MKLAVATQIFNDTKIFFGSRKLAGYKENSMKGKKIQKLLQNISFILV